MNAHRASLINALLLMALPLWAYFSAASPSVTALIPAAFGLLLLMLSPGVKSQHKIVSHLAVLATLLIIMALLMPFQGAINREDGLAIFRVGVMILSSVIALLFFIKSFIDVRRQR